MSEVLSLKKLLGGQATASARPRYDRKRLGREERSRHFAKIIFFLTFRTLPKDETYVFFDHTATSQWLYAVCSLHQAYKPLLMSHR